MHESQVTYKDKLDKEKEIVEEFLVCPRCYQTVTITPEIRFILDGYKNGNPIETIVINRADIAPVE